MAGKTLDHDSLIALFETLDQSYGDLSRGEWGWWPAETRFEILIGAILTQNTNWSNVEKAIENLRSRGWLSPAKLLAADEAEVQQAIRPSGYYRLKASRLMQLCNWFDAAGGFERLDDYETGLLRDRLLAVKGIGPETADDILCYAFGRPVFIVDTYTRRLFQRQGFEIDGASASEVDYETLRSALETQLAYGEGTKLPCYGQYHALIVVHANKHCRKQPDCTGCPVLENCHHGQYLYSKSH